MKFAYYPGCSLHSTAKEYDISTQAVFRDISVELRQVENWRCCGAFELISVDYFLWLYLVLGNLVAAAKINNRIVMPCSSCLIAHLKAYKKYQQNPSLQERLKDRLPQPIPQDLSIHHPLAILINDNYFERLKENIKRPLSKLKVVPYYGCVLLRPSRIINFDDPNNPTALERLLTITGAEILPFEYRLNCCGGALLLPQPRFAFELSKNILLAAEALQADCIALACPMCQITLISTSLKLGKKHKIAIVYFTQLLALALGLSIKQAGLNKIISSTKFIKLFNLGK